jgi:hypothetical protein
MKLSAVFLSLLLAGCATTVPVKPFFPNIPDSLKESCPELLLIPEGTEKLSEVLTVVTANYGEYHICRSRVDAWIKWYNEQKKIYEELK